MGNPQDLETSLTLSASSATMAIVRMPTPSFSAMAVIWLCTKSAMEFPLSRKDSGSAESAKRSDVGHQYVHSLHLSSTSCTNASDLHILSQCGWRFQADKYAAMVTPSVCDLDPRGYHSEPDVHGAYYRRRKGAQKPMGTGKCNQ